jgi:hypothetical protein
MKHRTIADVWSTYAATIPHDAPLVQRREMCRSFYAGFAGAFSTLVGVSHEEPDEDVAAARMELLHRELEAFADLQMRDDFEPPRGRP